MTDRDHAIRVAVGHLKDPVEREEAIYRILTSSDGVHKEVRRIIARKLGGRRPLKERMIQVAVFLPVEDFLRLRDKAKRKNLTLSTLLRQKVLK